MAEPDGDGRLPKDRVDALTDGVFAFAMTLLVINLDIPDGAHFTTGRELLAAFDELSDTFVAYIITFVVLAIFWIGRAQNRGQQEFVSSTYTWTVLAHLFFVTCMPFTMMVVGRFDFAPAVWLYGANMIICAATSLRLSFLIQRDTGRVPSSSGRLELTVLIASALLSMAVSLVAAKGAMWGYAFNFAAPLLRRWTGRD